VLLAAAVLEVEMKLALPVDQAVQSKYFDQSKVMVAVFPPALATGMGTRT
jgi:hypothetical protein